MARPVPDGFRRVRALSARTQFVPGHGQVHFDPDSSKFETRNPALPEDQINLLVGRDWVADDLSEADLADDDQAPATKRSSRKAKAVPTADDDQAPAA